MRGRRVLGWAASIVILAAAGGCAEPAPIEGRGYTQVWADQFNYALAGRDGPGVGAARALHLAADGVVGDLPHRGERGKYVRLLTGAFRNWEWTYISTAGPAGVRALSPTTRGTRAWEGGYFEARIRYSPNQWAWPSFWLFSEAKTENWPNVVCPPWAPLDGEFDILDSGRFDASALGAGPLPRRHPPQHPGDRPPGAAWPTSSTRYTRPVRAAWT